LACFRLGPHKAADTQKQQERSEELTILCFYCFSHFDCGLLVFPEDCGDT
jgi:hypothetical protein